jgi:hypothetical protein
MNTRVVKGARTSNTRFDTAEVRRENETRMKLDALGQVT